MSSFGLTSQPNSLAAQHAPRRAFKKSRQGCKTCKSRKVKCDERRPLCGNCQRRFPNILSCDFDRFIEVTRGRSKPVSGSLEQKYLPRMTALQPSLFQIPSGSSGSNHLRSLELRLMHHYTLFTCTQLPEVDPIRGSNIWALDIPRLAFHSDLVLSALLGIAALHHWALTPNDKQLEHAAGHFFDKAVRNHRAALARPAETSPEALIATAILICHHTWVSGHCSGSDERYEIPLQTYYMARGLLALFDQMWPMLAGSPYLWYVERQPVIKYNQTTAIDEFTMSVEEDLSLLSGTFGNEDVSMDDRVVYEKAVNEIRSMCIAINNETSPRGIQRSVATMPLRLPERFLQLVELKDPRALCLLARNLSLLQIIDSVWWLHGHGNLQRVAEISVNGIRDMLSAEWQWAMAWPARVVAGELRPRCITK